MSFTSTTNRNDYTGNGATDTYSYTFRIFANTDLLVTVRDTDDVETEYALTTDYTVTGVGDAGGGTIVLVAGNLTTDYALSIRRVRPLTQTTDIRNQGDFYPETHEDVFDHVVMIAQQQQDELDRTAKLPETISPSSFDPTIPADLVGEENRVIMTNTAGDAFALGPSAAEISGATVYTLFRSYVEIDDTDSPYTVAVGDTGKVFLCDCSSGAISVTLPEITTLTNQGPIAFKKTDSSTNALTINRSGSDTVEGATSMSITSPDTGFILVSTSGDVDWRLVGKFYSVVNAYGLFRTYASYVFADSPVTLSNESSGLMVRCDATNGAISVTLPQISSMTTMGPIAFKKTDSTTNAITINRAGSDTVDGGTSYSLSYADTTIILVPNSDDSAWVVTGNIYGDNPIFEATGSMTIPRGTIAQRPSSGVNGMMRYNSDIENFEGYQNSAWKTLGSGSGTGINYCDNADAESATTGWADYADAAGTSPVDGTGGAPTVAISRVVATDLRGVAHFRITKDAADRQGEGVSYAFSIDEADQGRMINVSFDYVASANYAAEDIHVWIYDVGNSALIPLTPYTLPGTSNNDNHQFNGVFQTAIDSTSYRLILHVSTTNASAYTLDFDNVQIGPQIKTYGAVVTDTVTYTPTISNGGTTSANNGYWQRSGDSMIGHIHTVFTGAGASAELAYAIPAGLAIDTTKINASVSTEALGVGQWNNATTDLRVFTVGYASATTFNFTFDSATSPTYGDILANNDVFSFNFKVPILGWSSNVQMSDDAETRVVACEYSKTAGDHTDTGNTQDLTGLTLVKDTHSAMNATTGIYSCPVAGWYMIAANLIWNGNNASLSRINVNHEGNIIGASSLEDITSTTRVGSAEGIAWCNAGDELKASVYQASGGDFTYSTATRVVIFRVSGPAQIAASEFIGASYESNAGNQINNGVSTTLDFEDKDYDTHSAVSIGVGAWDAAGGGNTTSNWKFTAPVSGKYSVKTYIEFADSGGWTAGEAAQLEVFKEGVNKRRLDYHEIEATGTFVKDLGGSTTIDLLSGEYIDIRISQGSGGNISLATSSITCWVTIEKVS